jgi:hypothetical protein
LGRWPPVATCYNRAVRARIWPLVWVLLAAALVVRATTRPEGRGVILDHLEFGRRLLAGQDVHGPWRSGPDAPVRPLHAPYPPSFGLLTAPFAVIADVASVRAARAAWALLQVASLCAVALALRRLCAGRDAPASGGPPGRQPWLRPLLWPFLWLGALLLASRWILRDMHGGGGNLVNLGLCALAFLLAEHRRPWSAAVLLGFSLATKPTQALLLPVFFVLGHRRAALGAVGAAALCAAASLALLRGDPTPWQRWWTGTVAFAAQVDAFAAPAHEFPPFQWMNQSLRCALARWLGTVPPELAARVPGGVAPGLGIPVDTVAWITRGLSGALLAATLLVGWRARGSQPGRLHAFAAALLLSPLLSPLSWKAYQVAALPAFYLLLLRAQEPGGRWVAWPLGLYVPTCVLGGDLLGGDLAERVNSLYVVTAWNLALLAVMLRTTATAGAAALAGSIGGCDRENAAAAR